MECLKFIMGNTLATKSTPCCDRRYGTILAPVTGEKTGKRFHQFNLLSDTGETLQPTLYVRISQLHIQIHRARRTFVRPTPGEHHCRGSTILAQVYPFDWLILCSLAPQHIHDVDHYDFAPAGSASAKVPHHKNKRKKQQEQRLHKKLKSKGTSQSTTGNFTVDDMIEASLNQQTDIAQTLAAAMLTEGADCTWELEPNTVSGNESRSAGAQQMVCRPPVKPGKCTAPTKVTTRPMTMPAACDVMLGQQPPLRHPRSHNGQAPSTRHPSTNMNRTRTALGDEQYMRAKSSMTASTGSLLFDYDEPHMLNTAPVGPKKGPAHVAEESQHFGSVVGKTSMQRDELNGMFTDSCVDSDDSTIGDYQETLSDVDESSTSSFESEWFVDPAESVTLASMLPVIDFV